MEENEDTQFESTLHSPNGQSIYDSLSVMFHFAIVINIEEALHECNNGKKVSKMNEHCHTYFVCGDAD